MQSGTVGIIGAGTMGAGIAQVAAQSGWTVHLLDVDTETVNRAVAGVSGRFDRLVEKGRMTADERDGHVARLRVATSAEDLADCGLVIEAIVEDLAVKARVLGAVVPHLASDAIIATNTSSLSIGELGRAIGVPERTVGMHFFNPAPLLKLVEVIAGAETSPEVADTVAAIAESWGKVVARAADVPGFIVNHVARPYYLEAFRIVEDGFVDPLTIDETMKQCAGFRMGPLELTDLIGQDVNTATSRSVWEQLDRPPLLTPSPLQESLVAAGNLGRKTGRGVYDYNQDPPAMNVGLLKFRKGMLMSNEALDAFVEHAIDDAASTSPTERYVIGRILAGLIVQGEVAAARGVATPEDIDKALMFGTNYPSGPFAWRDRIGADRVQAWLEVLNTLVDGDRFATARV